jgi:hypothetical protein
MKRFIEWFALAIFPNSKIANRPVKVSREEWLALKRENAESSQSAMGDTVKPDMMRRAQFSDFNHDSVEFLNSGKRLDGTNIEQSKNY